MSKPASRKKRVIVTMAVMDEARIANSCRLIGDLFILFGIPAGVSRRRALHDSGDYLKAAQNGALGTFKLPGYVEDGLKASPSVPMRKHRVVEAPQQHAL